MNTKKTVEDYLEAMLMAKEQHGYIRSIDVAELLNVKKPSVTYTTKRLKEKGLITMDADGLITITEEGMKIAQSTYDRHKLLTSFLEELGVSPQTAEDDACKLEHDFSEESYEAICSHIKKFLNKK